MSFPARTTSPRASIRPRISPARLRRTASGLMRISVRSTLTAPDYRCRARGLDRGLAVRTHLPERLERGAAVHARLPQLRRADRAHEEARVDLRPADRAHEVAAREAVLHRLDLELALAHVLEVLGRPEEHVHERPDVWDEAEHGG